MRTQPRLSDSEREERRERDRERLKQAAEPLLTSEGWQRWVRVRAQGGLARLSLNNQLLVALSCPDATFVAGFRAWLKLGYCVRTNAIGLEHAKNPSNQPRERSDSARRLPEASAQCENYPSHQTQYPRFHEITHALGVDYANYSRAQAEVIVDTTILVVLSGVGLDVSGETIPYVAGWGETGALEAVTKFAQLIDGLALRVAHAIEDTDGDHHATEHQIAHV
jgi:hypothetical protein